MNRLFLSILSVSLSFICSATQIDAARFGAIPDDGKNDMPALRKAARYCRENPGTTLLIRPGVYLLSDKEAVKLENDACSGKFGLNVEATVFKPYYPYVKGLDFTGATDVTVIADGVTFLCDGWMEPVSIIGTRNFTLKGLTVDYLRKPFSHGTVTGIGDGWFDITFSPERTITPELPLMRMTIWDSKLNRVDNCGPFYFPEHQVLDGNVVRFKGNLPSHLMGETANVNHCFHFRPAILILDSDNTVLDHVTINSQPGMGIVGFNTKDVLMKNLAVKPSAGYCQSTNTDATHFAACRGTIRFDACRFEGQGDDATNVHGYYQTITAINGNEASIEIKAPTYTHAQVIDAPAVGDTLEVVEIRTLKPTGTVVVSGVDINPPSTVCDIRFEGSIPADFSKYYLMNISKLPRLVFENSVVNSHLARGVLVKTRGVLIRDNVFRYCTGTAIHVGAEASWHEGSHAADVLIEGNMMLGCGSGAGSQGGASGISVIIQADDTSSSLLHKDITIRNNMIRGEGNRCGIFVGNADGVTLEGNSVSGCDRDITTGYVNNLTVGR